MSYSKPPSGGFFVSIIQNLTGVLSVIFTDLLIKNESYI